MMTVKGYATKHFFARLKPYEFEHEEDGPHGIEIDVLFYGVCHLDIHQIKNEWSNAVSHVCRGMK